MKYKEYNLPDNLLYNKDSSWIKIDKDIATLGVIEPIAKTLKEFLFIKFSDLKTIKKKEIYASLETLKWSGHLTSPLSGEIIEINQDLYDSPEKINKEPYASWIIKIKFSDLKEIKELFKAEEIIEWLEKTINKGD
ncbi:MAG: glycine cleavage system protein H [Candidatus ainarchaeum sp.]|nr:glycine cleavage system protein H [Candidatus ainarchaeum sp.]